MVERVSIGRKASIHRIKKPANSVRMRVLKKWRWRESNPNVLKIIY